jgi:hypothetical protein
VGKPKQLVQGNLGPVIPFPDVLNYVTIIDNHISHSDSPISVFATASPGVGSVKATAGGRKSKSRPGHGQEKPGLMTQPQWQEET